MEKHCSKCKAGFTCTNEKSGCWCEEITLTQQTLKELHDEFDNCLCPECLKTYAVNFMAAIDITSDFIISSPKFNR